MTGLNTQRVSVDSAIPYGLISRNTLLVLSCLICVVRLILRKYICKRINMLLRNYAGVMNKCFDQALTRDFPANLSRTKSQLPEKARFEHKNSRLTRDDSTYGLPCMDYQSSLRLFKDNVQRRAEKHIFPNVRIGQLLYGFHELLYGGMILRFVDAIDHWLELSNSNTYFTLRTSMQMFRHIPFLYSYETQSLSRTCTELPLLCHRQHSL
jgi:hypothetical protein